MVEHRRKKQTRFDKISATPAIFEGNNFSKSLLKKGNVRGGLEASTSISHRSPVLKAPFPLRLQVRNLPE